MKTETWIPLIMPVCCVPAC